MNQNSQQKTMKAAILTAQHSPLVVADVELPSELKYGQVFVKILYSSICGSQIGEIDGAKGADKYLPHLLGHEGSGIVEKCAEGVTIVKPGDHVVLHWREGKGISAATPQYTLNGQKVNAGPVTTFNEYAVVSENRVTAIPPDIDSKLAPLYGCALTTAFGVVHNDAQLKAGESIIVFGSGGVGMVIVQAAALASAYPIIAVDINNFKLEQAKKCGATHIFNSLQVNVAEKIRALLSAGADVVVDTTGLKPVRELAYDLTDKEGRTIFVGVPKQGEKMSLDTLPLHFAKKISGSHGGSAQPSYDIPRLVRLQQQGILKIDHFISHIYPLEKINEAIQQVRTGDVVRCLIKMNHD